MAPPAMSPPVRLALGQAQTGWFPHRARLQAFGQECEALVQGAIAFQLTDDAYIGQACFRLLGDIRRLDAAVFAQWVAACPWACTFVPTHAGYPCLFVSPGAPRQPPPGSRCAAVAKVTLAILLAIAASAWAATQTPPPWVPASFHELAGLPGGVALAAGWAV